MHSDLLGGNRVTSWRNSLASKPEGWLLLIIIVWGFAVALFAIYLVARYGDQKWVKYVLGGIILYELLP